jgi:hypothetical protein
MIHNSVISDMHLDSFRPLFVAASLLVIAFTCFIAHACALNGIIAEVLVIFFLLGWQIFAITCLQSKNIVVFSIMLVGLFLKLAAGWLQLGTAQWGASDQLMYSDQGNRIAATASSFQDFFTLKQLWGIDSGTQFIISTTAILFKLIGPSIITATVVFSLVAFWGQYLYYLTFREAFPDADSRVAALGLFMWPSIVFWTAELGKDALMLFSLGLCSYGVARLSKQKTPAIFALVVVGFLGAFFVRPHIATLLVMSIAASFILKVRTARVLTTSRRFVRLLLLAVFSVIVVFVCAQFLQLTSLADTMGRINGSMQSNALDGSGFNPGSTLASRLALAPLLLIRPYPWEINGFSAGLVSAEGVLLLVLVSFRYKGLKMVIKGALTSGFGVFVLWFVSLNVALFGMGMSNFGLLARQRVMILPMIALLLAASFHNGQVLRLNRSGCTSST